MRLQSHRDGTVFPTFDNGSTYFVSNVGVCIAKVGVYAAKEAL